MVCDVVAVGDVPWAPVPVSTALAVGAGEAPAGNTIQRAGLFVPYCEMIVKVIPVDIALTVGCATMPAVNDTLFVSSSACAQYLEE